MADRVDCLTSDELEWLVDRCAKEVSFAAYRAVDAVRLGAVDHKLGVPSAFLATDWTDDSSWAGQPRAAPLDLFLAILGALSLGGLVLR